MSYVKTIVCLANSYKPPSGRCIAGREVLADGYGGWVRPVSPRPTAEVSFSEYRYEDNSSPRLLDIIDVPLLNAEPKHHQTENHVIDAGRWVKRGTLSWERLDHLRDNPASLWVNRDSTNAGFHDCMSQEGTADVRDSLVLIKPETLSVEIGRNYWTSKKSYRADFRFNGEHYNLSLTDPAVLSAFSTKQEGDYPLQNAYLCVSLTEPYEHDDRCHKLVAAIITNPLM